MTPIVATGASEHLDAAPLVRSTGLESTITLARQHSSDCQQRQIFVRLDGRPRIALVFGQSVTLEVSPGGHLLSAHNTLFRKRVPFTIEPAEHLEFELINRDRWWTAGMAGVLGAAPLFLTVRRIRSLPSLE